MMRRWIDLTQAPLSEAINTSAIDRKARRVLQERLTKWIEREFEQFQAKQSFADAHDAYDAFYQRYRSDELFDPTAIHGSISMRAYLVRMLCDQASRALTVLLQEHLAGEYGHEINRRDEIMVPKMFKVKVEPRSDSIDPMKDDCGGYFNPSVHDPKIKVFVDADDCEQAAMDILMMIVSGESESPNHITNIIAPTFAHEYAHLEQFIRGGLGGDTDYGYISAGGGSRGGRRTPRDGTLPWLRYKSSTFEIEAFAAGTASELIAEISRYHSAHNEDGSIDDDSIKSMLESLAQGYADSRSLRGYRSIGWGEFTEEATKLGVKPDEMKTVWKRYLKLVYRAVSNYHQERIRAGGPRETHWHIRQAPESWRDAARTNGVGQCATIIAREITGQLLGKYPNDWNTTKDATSDDLVRKATSFIEAAYYAEDWNMEKSMAISSAFKGLVAKQYERRKEKLLKAA